MDYTKINVLVVDAVGKQAIAMMRGLRELGCHITAICSSKKSTGYASNVPNEKILNEHIAFLDEQAEEELMKLVRTGKYDVVMPVGELATNFVTSHEDEFKKYVKLACAPREIYIKAFNKQTTFDTAIENEIPCPFTRHSKQNIEEFLEECKFPIIIKPRQGLGSIGFHKFENREDFWPYMNGKGLNPDDYVIQEFVDFEKRIGTNLFVDQKGNVCTSYAVDVLRWFPIDAGAGVLIQTVDAHEVLQYAGKLLQALKWRGFANVAFMLDKETGEPRLLEINGRIPASVRMAYMCGCNVSRQMLDMVYEEKVIQYPENNKFGMYLRHFDTDIAWFLKSPDRFKTNPSWFSWKNTQEVLFFKDDKKPFWVNLFNKTISYKEKMKKKQH